MSRRGLVLLLVLVSSACGSPSGVRNDATGLTGVPTPSGALAGAWALVADFQTIVTAPLLGDELGRFTETYAVTLDTQEGGAYALSMQRCTRTSVPIAGTRMVVAPEVFPRLQRAPGAARVDAAKGLFTVGEAVELWGVTGLPDPALTPLPKHADYQQAPQSGWLLDEDGDGKPALTEQAVGNVSGTAQVVERVVFGLDGTVLSTDRVQGLASLVSNDVNRLEASNPLLLGEATTRQDPSRVSWFDAARVTGAGGCDEVAQAQAEGRLATKRPF